MVFTVPVRVGRVPRRALLRATVLGAAATTAGGCGLLRSEPPAAAPGVDPLDGLRTATAALADRYDATIRRHANLEARLRPLLNNHRAHLEALDRQIVGTPSASVAPSISGSAPGVPATPAAAVAALLAAEKSALPSVAAACLDGPSWRAALLGSIAAARATHVEALS
jgi:hypothetical protein